MVEFFLFIPQIRLPMADIVERARTAESVGFDGVAFIDHLVAPGAEQQPLWEAMTVASWVAARTNRLRVGHLVLCDAFRHPAVLAKQAVTLQEASGGRFELGLGSGSIPAELIRFDITRARAAERRAARAHIGVVASLLGCDGASPSPPTCYADSTGAGRDRGEDAGVGPGVRDLVESARDGTGPIARSAALDRVGWCLDSADDRFRGAGRSAEEVRAVSARRFGYLGDGLRCGDAEDLVEHFRGLARLGVGRFYVWFADFAPPTTLAEFGESVVRAVRDSGIGHASRQAR